MIHITEPQRQQIMQTKEFADKFNELTEGWKPSKYPDVDYFNTVRKGMINSIPFAQFGMDMETYMRFRNAEIRELEWGLLHKVLAHGMTLPPTSFPNYPEFLANFYDCLKEIEQFVAKQREECVKSVFLQLKAKNSLIK